MPGDPAGEAADRIRERRARCDQGDFLPDDPAGVARYVRMHRRGIPAAVLTADMEDALVIRRALREESDREDLGVIQAARACGITWARIAEIWGFRGRQGPKEMAARLEAAAVPDGRRDARVARARHRAAAREEAWLLRRHDAITRCIQQVVACRPDHDQDEALADAMADLAEAHGNGDSTPRQMLALLSLVVQAHDATSPHGPDLACAALGWAQRLTGEWPRPAE